MIDLASAGLVSDEAGVDARDESNRPSGGNESGSAAASAGPKKILAVVTALVVAAAVIYQIGDFGSENDQLEVAETDQSPPFVVEESVPFETTSPPSDQKPRRLAADVSTVTADGDNISARIYIRPPILATSADAPQSLSGCVPMLDGMMERALFVPLEIELRLESSLPVNLNLIIYDGYGAYVLIYRDGVAQCGQYGKSGAHSDSFSGEALLTGWVMVPDAVTPNAPTGDLSRLNGVELEVVLGLPGGGKTRMMSII